MKKVKFIYNPYSGENTIKMDIDKIIRIHQKKGYSVTPFRISVEATIDEAFYDINEGYCHILIAGGDGTVDTIVNYIKNNNINLPIGIIPAGTANDFAKFIGMPMEVSKACEKILSTQPKKIDIGKINEKYFINVASTGLFTDVSQKIDVNLKNTIGKLAYYIKGIEQLPSFRSLKIRVESEEVIFDGDMYLMLVFNGQTAGNLKLAYKASVDDGMLDVIIIKGGAIKDLVALFINMIKGDHLEGQQGLVYFKTNKLEIQCYEDIVTDIDGERGPNFPLVIECIKGGIEILGITNEITTNI